MDEEHERANHEALQVARFKNYIAQARTIAIKLDEEARRSELLAAGIHRTVQDESYSQANRRVLHLRAKHAHEYVAILESALGPHAESQSSEVLEIDAIDASRRAANDMGKTKRPVVESLPISVEAANERDAIFFHGRLCVKGLRARSGAEDRAAQVLEDFLQDVLHGAYRWARAKSPEAVAPKEGA